MTESDKIEYKNWLEKQDSFLKFQLRNPDLICFITINDVVSGYPLTKQNWYSISINYNPIDSNNSSGWGSHSDGRITDDDFHEWKSSIRNVKIDDILS